MAKVRPWGNLIECAARAFELAKDLATSFHDKESQIRAVGVELHRAIQRKWFLELHAILDSLAEEIQAAPEGFEAIAEALREIRQALIELQAALRKPDVPRPIDLTASCSALHEIQNCGASAVKNAYRLRSQLGQFALPDAIFDDAIVTIETAGDLWTALLKGQNLWLSVSAVDVSKSEPLKPFVILPSPADQLKRKSLDRALALCDLEGGTQGEAMTKIIARVLLTFDGDQCELLALPLPQFIALAIRRQSVDTADDAIECEPSNRSSGQSVKKRGKRSTERGEGRLKLMAALSAYHKYEAGSCQNYTPVGSNELARMARVATSTASKFFVEEFGGYGDYRTACNHPGRVAAKLKRLNQEYVVGHTFGRRPASERENGDDE